MIFGTGPAVAEPGNREQAYQECQSRKSDLDVAKEIVKNKEFGTSGDVYDALKDKELVQRLKEEHPQRFEEIRQKQEQDQGWEAKLRRGTKGAVCTTKSPLDAGVAKVSNKVSEFWDDPVGKFVHALVEGNTEALQTAMTFWTKFKIDGGKTSDQATGVRNIVWSAAAIAFILSIIVTGARMAATRRQGLADGMEDFGKFYGSYLVVGVMVPLIIPLALAGTDWLADQILTGLPDGKKFTDLMGVNQLGDDVSGPALMLVLVLFALLGSLTQLVALAARVLILPIVVGLLPLAAASAAGQAGRASMQSLLSWTFAAIAFKPIAAMVYVVAFWVVSDNTITGPGGAEGEAGLRILKVLLLGMAGFSPLLVVRIISPLMASAGGQNSGAVAAMAGGAIGAGGAVLGGVATALGGGSRALSSASRAVGGGKTAGGSSGGSGGSRTLGGSPSGPSGGPSGGGSPSGGAPIGGAPSGGSPAGGSPVGGGAQGGSPAGSMGGHTDGMGSAPSSVSGASHSSPGTGGSPRQGSQNSGVRNRPDMGRAARRVGAGALRGGAATLGAAAGGTRIAARVAANTGAFARSTNSLSGVFEDAGGTIRK
ncbi:hypothetical protein [Corynebacterium auriscanis]|uniref:hypothetical protein n=1 Tax=Corynebacterium auriscanis TaxID=99807 RepID=UPI003CECB2B7